MAMTTGMAMMVAAQARRRRDERGRYMDTDMRRPYNREMPYRAEGEQMARRGRENRSEMDDGADMRGEGYFVWDRANEPHMPPERYGRPEGKRMTRTPERHYSPYGDQPDVYKQQDDRSNRWMEDDNIVSLDTFAHKTDPLDQRDGKEHMERKQPRQIGFQSNSEKGLDKQTVMEWVESMEDGEGVKGGKYTWHQAQQYAMNKGITGEKRMLEFYAAMNAMYTDFHEAGKKFGVDKPDFYACLAKLFIEDPDAVDDKMEKYYEHVVKHDKNQKMSGRE